MVLRASLSESFHVVDHAVDAVSSQEAESGLDILNSLRSKSNVLVEVSDIQGVQESCVVVRNISLVEETEGLGHVQSRVALFVVGNFRSRGEAHAKVLHASNVGEVAVVGVSVIE